MCNMYQKVCRVTLLFHTVYLKAWLGYENTTKEWILYTWENATNEQIL